MKRTEAIAWLEVMKEDAIFEQYDALKMAIEALQADVVPKHDVEIIIDEITKHTSQTDVVSEALQAEPTHGRLIDVDELIKKYATCADIDCDTCPIWECGCDGLLQILKEAPIIKDANGGEDK